MGPLVFVHIPKTGGTTLHKILVHQYHPKRVETAHDTDGPLQESLLARMRDQRDGVRLVLGHVSARFHDQVPDVRYLTCLREPAARVRSHYQHARSDPNHYLHEPSCQMSLREYASSGLSGELSNGMVRMLSGMDDFHRGTPGETELQRAIEVLEHRTVAFCLTERFEESLLLMANRLQWKCPWFVRRKVGGYSRCQLTPDERSAIQEMNQLDCRLYDHARKLLDEALAGESSSRDPDRFMKMNRWVGPWMFFGRELFHRCGGVAPF